MKENHSPPSPPGRFWGVVDQRHPLGRSLPPHGHAGPACGFGGAWVWAQGFHAILGLNSARVARGGGKIPFHLRLPFNRGFVPKRNLCRLQIPPAKSLPVQSRTSEGTPLTHSRQCARIAFRGESSGLTTGLRPIRYGHRLQVSELGQSATGS